MDGLAMLGSSFGMVIIALVVLRQAYRMMDDANARLRAAAEAYSAATYMMERHAQAEKDTRQLELMLVGGKMND